MAFDVGEFEDGAKESDVAAVDEIAEASVCVEPFGESVPVESQADIGFRLCGLHEVVGAVGLEADDELCVSEGGCVHV